jgi:hypothetical protein
MFYVDKINHILGNIWNKFHLKPICNFEENPTQTRDITSKLPGFSLCLFHFTAVTSPVVASINEAYLWIDQSVISNMNN